MQQDFIKYLSTNTKTMYQVLWLCVVPPPQSRTDNRRTLAYRVFLNYASCCCEHDHEALLKDLPFCVCLILKIMALNDPWLI